MTSSSKMFGFAMIGVSLFFLLRKEASAQESTPSEEITPSVTSSMVSSIEASSSIVTSSPTPAPTKSVSSQAPSSSSEPKAQKVFRSALLIGVPVKPNKNAFGKANRIFLPKSPSCVL